MKLTKSRICFNTKIYERIFYNLFVNNLCLNNIKCKILKNIFNKNMYTTFTILFEKKSIFFKRVYKLNHHFVHFL